MLKINAKKNKKEKLQRIQRKQKLLKQRLLLRSRNQNLMLYNNKTGVIKV